MSQKFVNANKADISCQLKEVWEQLEHKHCCKAQYTAT